MEKLISSCGLNCSACDAYIATINDDDKLRKLTADKWRVEFNAAGITPDMINCTGCREPGAKFSHCELCEIRKCVRAKGFGTCAECSEMDSCTIVSAIHQYVPEAVANLRSLKQAGNN